PVMGTLRDRVDERDRARFVGRARQIAAFERILRGEVAHNVVHLTGPGGIGKSAVLREVARRAAGHGFRVIWIEGRDVPPFPEAIDYALSTLGDGPAFVVLDSYELISSLDSHLREIVIPSLPASTIVA